MLRIGSAQLGHIPRIVLGVGGSSASLSQASTEGVDIVEVRVDQFARLDPAHVVDEIRSMKRHGLPLIGTIRSRKEGGHATIADSKRLALYREMAPWVDAMDIELHAASILKETVAIARQHGIVVIVSFHDLSETPPNEALEASLETAQACGADIMKIAAFAKQEHDVIRLLQLTVKHRAKHLVTIAMGSIGSISRVVFPLAGSLMTYTNVSPSDGQLPLPELVEHLRRYYPRFNQEFVNRQETRKARGSNG